MQVSPASGWAGSDPAFVLSWQKSCQGRTIWSFVPACPSQVKGWFSFGLAGVKAAPVLAAVEQQQRCQNPLFSARRMGKEQS